MVVAVSDNSLNSNSNFSASTSSAPCPAADPKSDHSNPPDLNTSNDVFADLKLPRPSLFPAENMTIGKLEKIYKSDIDPDIDEAITLMAQDVRTATTSLIGQTYIFDPYSQGAQELFKSVAWAQRKNPKFEFALIVNAFSSPDYDEIVQQASLYGVAMRLGIFYNGITRGSLHSKSWVLDGKFAYVGGDNVDNKPENDYMACFRGAVIAEVEADLLEAWRESNHIQLSEGLRPIDLKDIINLAKPDFLEASQEYPIAVLTKDKVAWYRTRTGYYQNEADQSILSVIDSATKSVQIMGPNINDAEVLEALCRAAERGVKVQVLLPKGYQRLMSWIDRATNSLPLIYRSRLSFEAAKNFDIRFYSEDGKNFSDSHAKFYGVDGKIAILGSQNPDSQSFRFSREFSLAICDSEAAKLARQELFDRSWKTSITAPEKLWHRLCPIPGRTSTRRFLKYLITPVELAENLIKIVNWKTGRKDLFQFC